MNISHRTRIVLFTLLLFPSLLFSQSSEERFIKLLISNSDSVINYVDNDEMVRANRLGISYTGVKNKWLIGFDIDEQVKGDLKEGRMQYEVSVKQLEDGFSVAEFSVPQIKYSKSFYFKNGKFVPNSDYFTRSWQSKESRYFIFKISEPKYFNDYCIRKLDEFVDRMADTLEFSDDARELLKEQKLYYIFCKDESEVEQLTGYKSKGQAILAYDEVITAFQTHYHELVHLLINYKLKNLGLYTLPFFMEGFAVAMGGRGGMAPRVVTDLGYYLQKTAFLTYDSILTYEAFMGQDANMTYAVSGLYNTFLFKELGVNKYLELYKSVNGDLEFVKSNQISSSGFSNSFQFETFLNKYFKNETVRIIIEDSMGVDRNDRSIRAFGFETVFKKGWIWVATYGDILIGPERSIEVRSKYISRKLEELYPERQNSNYQYLIRSDSTSISVINLFSDEIVTAYRSQFSLDSKLIPMHQYYYFYLKENLFEVDFNKGFIFISPNWPVR